MFEIEQPTVESQGRFNVTDLESNMIETGYRAFVASDIELLQLWTVHSACNSTTAKGIVRLNKPWLIMPHGPIEPLYHRRRFPAEIISHCVWLYFRFCLSYRDVEEMMAERGVVVTYETIRDWSQK